MRIVCARHVSVVISCPRTINVISVVPSKMAVKSATRHIHAANALRQQDMCMTQIRTGVAALKSKASSGMPKSLSVSAPMVTTFN